MSMASAANNKISQDDQGCQGRNQEGGFPLAETGTLGDGGSPRGQPICQAPRQGEAPLSVPLDGVMGMAPGGGGLQQAWGNFLDQIGRDLLGWDWYCTLTFRDPDEKQRRKAPNWTQPGWSYAHRALHQFTRTLLYNRFDAGKEQPYWIALMEMQKWRGVPHWHLLMGNCGDLRRLDWVDWWWEGFGIARILPYHQELGARFYLGKYLTKDIADIQASPQLRKCHRRAVASSSHVRG
ncbi:hypothetical protein ES703_37674 [subsurface metagenome]